MVKLSWSIAIVCASSLSACVSTPPLEEATGTSQSDIMINDVVQRVKCELAYAFDKKTEERDFLWLASWTVNVQLTLDINDSAGISPNGSFTSYRRNAVNFDAGPSTYPATVARSVVPQFFTFGAGATLNSQAVRTETLSFTLALDELSQWWRKQQLLERDPAFPIEKRACNPEWRSGVLGNLGLKEWVNSAFYPVEFGALEAGIHPQPLSQKPGNVPANRSSPTAPVARAPQQQKKYTCEQMKNKIGSSLSKLKRISSSIEFANAAVTASDKKITSSASSLDTKIGALRTDYPNYKYILSDNFRQRYNRIDEYSNSMWKFVTNSAICVSRLKNITTGTLSDINKSIPDVEKLSEEINKLTDCSSDEAQGNYINFLTGDTEKLLATKDVENAQTCADVTQKQANDSVILASILPSQIDPPV